MGLEAQRRWSPSGPSLARDARGTRPDEAYWALWGMKKARSDISILFLFYIFSNSCFFGNIIPIKRFAYLYSPICRRKPFTSRAARVRSIGPKPHAERRSACAGDSGTGESGVRERFSYVCWFAQLRAHLSLMTSSQLKKSYLLN